jgi:hypothetical protein
MIWPGASRLLTSWGLEDAFKAVSDEVPSVLLRDLKSGRTNMTNIAVHVSEWLDWGVSRLVFEKLLFKKAKGLA